jgi:hypothetical protein
VQYSVYNIATRAYDYYEDGRADTTHAGAPPAALLATGKPRIGVSPESATWRLPWGAKKVGSGPLPKGRIASTNTALGELVELGPVPLSAVLMVGAGYLAWRLLK